MFRRTEIRVHGNRRDENFDYEHGEMDKSREEFGEEFEHAEYCDFIYGNCNCVMSDPDVSESDRILKLIERYD